MNGVSVATECRLSRVSVQIAEEGDAGALLIPVQPVAPVTPVPTPLPGPGGAVRGIGLLVGAVLAAVGLHVVVRGLNETAGQQLLRLLERLRRDPQDRTDTETRIETKEDQCDYSEFLERLGKGGFPVLELEEQWNEFGEMAVERLQEVSDEFGFLSFGTLAGAENVAEEWEFQFGALINCVEMEIENNIRCSRPPGPRCRVPAMVKRCKVRLSDMQEVVDELFGGDSNDG